MESESTVYTEADLSRGDYNRGVYYLAIGWVLTSIAIIVVCTRLYSRAYITRSIGSDDYAVVISMCLSAIGECFNTVEVRAGLGRHEWYLTRRQFHTVEQWEYISWMVVFVSFFFLRASVLLFVLRLLPPNKRWQKRCILGLFFLNFATAMIALVSFGVKCIPFHDIWSDKPNRNCRPSKVNTATFYVNGILACVVDVFTAMIPVFLLWNVPMKRKTKIQLNCIFGAGLLTAGLSIGRVAASNDGVWETDNTWRIIPSDTFSLVEEKLGIICASLPALRQLHAYRKRVKTALPTSERQPPNEDFARMRRKIHMRDIFWYRDPSSTASAEHAGAKRQLVFSPRAGETVEEARKRQTATGKRPENSAVDNWEQSWKRFFFGRKTRRRSSDENHLGYDIPSGLTSDRHPSDSSGDGEKRPSGALANERSWWSPHRLLGKSSRKDNLQSLNRAQAARLDISAERGQGWPGVASQTGRRQLNFSYKNWGLVNSSTEEKRGKRAEEDADPDALPGASEEQPPPIIVPSNAAKTRERGPSGVLGSQQGLGPMSSSTESEKTVKGKPGRDGNVTPQHDDRSNFLDSRTTAVYSPTGGLSQAKDEWDDEPSPMTNTSDDEHKEGWDIKTAIRSTSAS